MKRTYFKKLSPVFKHVICFTNTGVKLIPRSMGSGASKEEIKKLIEEAEKKRKAEAGAAWDRSRPHIDNLSQGFHLFEIHTSWQSFGLSVAGILSLAVFLCIILACLHKSRLVRLRRPKKKKQNSSIEDIELQDLEYKDLLSDTLAAAQYGPLTLKLDELEPPTGRRARSGAPAQYNLPDGPLYLEPPGPTISTLAYLPDHLDPTVCSPGWIHGPNAGPSGIFETNKRELDPDVLLLTDQYRNVRRAPEPDQVLDCARIIELPGDYGDGYATIRGGATPAGAVCAASSTHAPGRGPGPPLRAIEQLEPAQGPRHVAGAPVDRNVPPGTMATTGAAAAAAPAREPGADAAQHPAPVAHGARYNTSERDPVGQSRHSATVPGAKPAAARRGFAAMRQPDHASEKPAHSQEYASQTLPRRQVEPVPRLDQVPDNGTIPRSDGRQQGTWSPRNGQPGTWSPTDPRNSQQGTSARDNGKTEASRSPSPSPKLRDGYPWAD